MLNADAGNAAIRWTKLPFVFDAALLRSEVAGIADDAWVAHFNKNDYAGEWSSVSLRSRSGNVGDIVPMGHGAEYFDTPLMESCPHLRAVVEAFDFPKRAVRLMRLHPGASIKEHCDRDLGLADGEVRIHVPVETSDKVEFIVAGRVLPLREGESWFIDFSQPHRVRNDGEHHRIHLVIDGSANERVFELLERSLREIVTETFDPPGVLRLETFREMVWEDAELQAELLGQSGLKSLCEAVVVAGARRGLAFSVEDAESVYRQSEQEWKQKAGR
ncbi:MAG: aspartyl/asparaginyl beta-hydroxylase domain-containing protein [Acidobacteriota bacterium]